MTIEELEAKLEIVSRERDEAKKEAAESSKEMIMLYNDHSSVELEKQLRIEELTRERDKFQALAELGEGYRRERDVACDDLAFILTEYANERNEELNEDALCLKIAGLTHQRDEARAEVERLRELLDENAYERGLLARRMTEAQTRRDEARAEAEAMRKAIMHAFPVFTESDEDECTWDECIEAAVQNLRELRRERNEAFDEVQRLADERDELLVRVADQGAELRATRDAYGTAYRRGAEVMQNACAATIHDGGLVWTRESAERALREIGILEEP